MNLSERVASNFREVYYSGDWVAPNLKEQLKGVTFEQATTQIHDLNTILKLTYHIYYYVEIILKVLKGGQLEGSDKLSFNHPDISTEEEWQNFLSQLFAKAEEFAMLVEQIPEREMFEGFADGKYGTNYRNLVGNIEHAYYHLGQIAILKKLVAAEK